MSINNIPKKKPGDLVDAEEFNSIVFGINALTPEMYGAVGDGIADDTVAIQNMHNENPKYVRYPKNYKITSPITVKSNCIVEIIGEVKIDKHGYRAFIVSHSWNVHFKGSGKITGHGFFPGKDISSVQGEGEKRFCFDNNRNWPAGYDSTDSTLGAFGGGFIGNGGCGIYIYGGGNISIVGPEISGFNFSGVSIGDAIENKVSTQPIIDGVYIECTIHNCYDNGISMLSCKNVKTGKNTLIYNIGHPDAVDGDASINPGYGVSGRLIADAGNPVRGAHISGTFRDIKRKALDVHSGYDIHFKDVIVKNTFITGLSISKGFTGNITLKNAYIENCGTKTDSTIEHRSGVMVWCPDAVIENVQVKNSGKTQSVLVLEADRTKIKDLTVEGNGIQGRPVNFTTSTLSTISGLTIKGGFDLPILFKDSTGKAAEIDTRAMTKTTASDPDVQFLGVNEVDIKESSYSRPLIKRTENTGDYFHAESIVRLEYQGGFGVASKILKGEKYISAVVAGTSAVEIQGLDGSRNYQDTQFTATATVEDASPTKLPYSRIKTLGSESTNIQKLVVLVKDDTDANISTTSTTIEGLVLIVRVQWTFTI
jgi:hypothetical protein